MSSSGSTSSCVVAYELAPYIGSRDYRRLAELAREASIICVVDYNGMRDVARTNYTARRPGDEIFSVSSRGMGYITAFNEADFISMCGHRNLEFFEPAATRSPGA